MSIPNHDDCIESFADGWSARCHARPLKYHSPACPGTRCPGRQIHPAGRAMRRWRYGRFRRSIRQLAQSAPSVRWVAGVDRTRQMRWVLEYLSIPFTVLICTVCPAGIPRLDAWPDQLD